eukprot:15054129-Alexandrium_andersonii.AAC.1
MQTSGAALGSKTRCAHDFGRGADTRGTEEGMEGPHPHRPPGLVRGLLPAAEVRASCFGLVSELPCQDLRALSPGSPEGNEQVPFPRTAS